MKNYNMILIDKLQKYQLYHQAKLINTNILQEEILPSYQKQVIEQAKFTYLLLGKAFEKQAKTIEGQGEKQVEAIKEHGKESVKSNEDVYKNNTLHENQDDGIFDKLSNKRIGNIYNLSKQINFNNLTYYFNSKGSSLISFIGFKGPLNLYKNIHNGDITIKDAEKD